MQQNEVFFMGGTVITIGILGAATFPYKITSPPGCIGGQIKLLGAVGSTVQILPNAVSGSTIGGATSLIGGSLTGYPLVTSEMFPWYGPANFYLACTGATATIAACFEFTSGGATLA